VNETAQISHSRTAFIKILFFNFSNRHFGDKAAKILGQSGQNGPFLNSSRPFRFATASADYVSRISVTIRYGRLQFHVA